MAKNINDSARVKVCLSLTLKEIQQVEEIKNMLEIDSRAKAVQAVFNHCAEQFILENGEKNEKYKG